MKDLQRGLNGIGVGRTGHRDEAIFEKMLDALVGVNIGLREGSVNIQKKEEFLETYNAHFVYMSKPFFDAITSYWEKTKSHPVYRAAYSEEEFSSGKGYYDSFVTGF